MAAEGASAPGSCELLFTSGGGGGAAVSSLIQASQEAHVLAREHLALEQVRLLRHKALRKRFYDAVKTADGYKAQYARAEKCLNRFLISRDGAEFTREMRASGVHDEQAATVAAATAREVDAVAALSLDDVADDLGGDLPELIVDGDSAAALAEKGAAVTLRLGMRNAVPLSVPAPIWTRLRRRFGHFYGGRLREQGERDEAKVKAACDAAFPDVTAWMRLKYLNLTAGRGGLQDAVPAEVMKVLFDRLEVSCEMFASPLNSSAVGCDGDGAATPPYFCSIYGDSTDCFYGSVGSAFDLDAKQGSFEVNPPFTESVFNVTYARIMAMLGASDLPLSFAIIVPAWSDTPGIVKLRTESAEYLVREIVVPKDKHCYCDGLSGEPAPMFVRDTLVFLLMNKAGAERWATPASKIDELSTALLQTWMAVEPSTRKRKF